MRPLGLLAALFLVALIGPVLALGWSVEPETLVSELRTPSIVAAIGTSLASSLIAIALASACGIPAAYALARARGPLRTIGIFAAALPLGLPPVAVGVLLLGALGTHTPLGALAARFGLGFVDAFPGVVVAEWYVSAPFVVIAATAAFAEIDPHLEEAARSLGASTIGVFVRVALPIAAPSIAAGVLLGWLRALGEYGATSVLAYHPAALPVALAVTLAADGLKPALAVSAFFVLTALCVVAAQAIVRKRVL